MLQRTMLQVLAALLGFQPCPWERLGQSIWGKGLCLRSEGKTKLRQELSGLDGRLGEGDNWYKELESRW